MSKLTNFLAVNSKDPDVARRAGINWIMLIYFVSGTCSLIDEVVWVRLLKLTLGNTVYASSVVVSVFMGGLALGALIMSRYSDKVVKHLRLYALLEGLITISALSIPLTLKLADKVYIWFFREFDPSSGQLLTVQVIVSAAVLLVPSVLMGSTLPLLGRFVTSLEKEVGHLVGRLYALNTLGAATGCFIAGFVLIRSLGVMGSLYTAAALNLLVAFGGWLLSRRAVEEEEQLQVEAITVEAPELTPAKTAAGGRFYVLIFAFFMSGLISIGYELLWMRSIIFLLGGVTYVFSAVLTVYLLGNVIGVGIGSRLARRLKVPAFGFAVTLSLLGLYGVFFLPILIYWTSNVLPHIKPLISSINTWLPVSFYMLDPIIQSLGLFLVPSIIMGIGFPIALQAWANHVHKVGKSTGTGYGANTIGAVVGGIVTGFVMIPKLGLQVSVSILGVLGVWIAVVMCLYFSSNLKKIVQYVLVAVAVIVSAYAVKAPKDKFHEVVDMSPYVAKRLQLVWVEEGTTTTVSVHRDLRNNSLELFSSGQAVAGDSYGTRTDQKILGHLCVMLNKNTKKAATVGFGSGETTKCLSTHQLDLVTGIEIAPEVVRTSLKFFSHINLGDRLDEEIDMVYMDAKNYLHLTDVKYDAIVNDSIHPRAFAENASLHTREYFENARDRLNSDGIMVCWIPVYDMPLSVLKSIIGTYMEVFPNVTLWYPNHYHVNYFWLVGSMQPQTYSPEHIDNELAKEAVAESLGEIDIANSHDVLAYYVADEKALKKHLGDYELNSDYYPYVEFTTEGVTPVTDSLRELVLNIREDTLHEHIDWAGYDEKQKEKWLADYKQLYNASTYLLRSYMADNNLEQLKLSMKGLAILPDNPGLLHSRQEAENLLYAQSIKFILAGNPNAAFPIATELLKVNPKSAKGWMIRSGGMLGLGDLDKALVAAKEAVKFAPKDPDTHYNVGAILLKQGKLEDAVISLRKACELDNEKESVLNTLASALILDGRSETYNPSEAVRLAQKACEITGYQNIGMINTLASAYAASGRFNEAVSTMEKAIDQAKSEGQKELVKSLSERMLLYKTGRLK